MRAWTKLFVVVATATMMMAMGPVFASTFTVNSTGNGGDQDLNNGV